jgi:hypothetical protein
LNPRANTSTTPDCRPLGPGNDKKPSGPVQNFELLNPNSRAESGSKTRKKLKDENKGGSNRAFGRKLKKKIDIIKKWQAICIGKYQANKD